FSPMYCSFIIPRPPPTSTRFPYTTLFRSRLGLRGQLLPRRGRMVEAGPLQRLGVVHEDDQVGVVRQPVQVAAERHPLAGVRGPRSEEHTSELQSRENLVCRLLLEKKKTTS